MEVGIYEALLTTAVQRAIGDDDGVVAQYGDVDDVEQPLVLARHLSRVLEKVFRGLSTTAERTDLAARLLGQLPHDVGADDGLAPVAPYSLPRLEAIRAVDAAPSDPTTRPATPLSDAALMTNSPHEPNLSAELRAELASADGVDLLCAFIRWEGLRLLDRQLAELRERSVPVRVLTTTYLGATDARALDTLVDQYGAQVRVNYEVGRTRLHAKAWLLRRRSTFDTAYVGSSNLSVAALVDGLEWNVRLSAVATPHLLDKFAATFDSYWESREFEDYRPRRDGERLRHALEAASGKGSIDRLTVTLSGLDVQPKPFQAEMLEQLEAERTVHGRHRNLVVAATGTGKTVVAALDYRRLRRSTGEDLTLLFVAHRAEILQQSRRMYQEVLNDATFGELLVDSAEPSRWRHVFASVASLTPRRLSQLRAEQFDIVVIDEFHHAAAPTYRRVLDHFSPRELLGLTATPERADGEDIRAYFDGRTAVELRLWEALEQNLLCPFHYFAVHDGTDLRTVAFRRGAYDTTQLSGLYTADDARVRIVIRQLRDKVADIAGIRALGFCVSVDHARFMADRFATAGIPARAVSGETSAEDRRDALRALKAREINVVFAVDLFNEGLDIPEIDTVLFLRPTESATVFLQQLGRGLRLTADKTVLTALDFVGHQRREFRFDQRLAAMTGVAPNRLRDGIRVGFAFLPSGSQIILDDIVRQDVLDNVRRQLEPRRNILVEEVRGHEDDRLASYLAASGRRLSDFLRSDRSWTTLRREAGYPSAPAGPREGDIVKRLRALAHVDDRRRRDAYRRLLYAPAADHSVVEQRLAEMLRYSLSPSGAGDLMGLAATAGTEVLDEIGQIVDLGFASARRATTPVGRLVKDLIDVPLELHASYSREEILAGLGWTVTGNRPDTHVAGVAWCAAARSDALFITLRKSERDFSPTTMYRDYALNEQLFHWESQSATSPESPVGRRYIGHRAAGTHILLFVREARTSPYGAAPYVFLGPADYVSHQGSRPMAVVWRLHRPMPTETYLASRAAVA